MWQTVLFGLFLNKLRFSVIVEEIITYTRQTIHCGLDTIEEFNFTCQNIHPETGFHCTAIFLQWLHQFCVFRTDTKIWLNIVRMDVFLNAMPWYQIHICFCQYHCVIFKWRKHEAACERTKCTSYAKFYLSKC